MKEVIDKVLIVSLTPYFLERDSFWYEKNLRRILQSRKTQTFWRENTLFLEKDQEIGLSELLRKLDEMGYEKVFKVSSFGEFSQRGGIVDIFPVNLNFALRCEFLGNRIEGIEKLSLEITEEKKEKAFLKKKLKSQKLFSDLRGLKPGDYLTHLDHGVAQFSGIANRYYVLNYAGGDKLYVPFGLERKLSRYIGFRTPKISRLGSSLWQRTKKKIKEETEKFARELLEMFAEKEVALRAPLKESKLEEVLDSTFEHNLTPDQIKALEDIHRDFLGEKPMDRIVLGDVGFGKTEIALRAAVRAAENDKQAALISPTTILANQHFDTFQKRLNSLPVKVGVVSRLQTKKQQRKILEDLARGKIDILIGTHRILGKDVSFQNLGLLIIDDEQKFGVEQKEKLRKISPAIDVLSLSATPIPRTLYMGLSSLKNISLIQTPPEGRKTIKTFVGIFGAKIIKKAVERELERDGQIYFLHNRVETIGVFKKFLESLETGARIEILHGRLREKEIAKVMEDFQKGRFNLLLATTIIENGLDIPKVNTLIVDDAAKLGLSQAYQIRGRIGRGFLQSFAYFLYPRKRLSPRAEQRIRALREATDLGAGYKIARKDLEIRGAGNILGREQSGNVNKVGLNLYCQILSEAIERLRKNGKIT